MKHNITYCIVLYFTKYAHNKVIETYQFMLNMNQSELSRTRNTNTVISVVNQSYRPQVYILLSIQLWIYSLGL